MSHIADDQLFTDGDRVRGKVVVITGAYEHIRSPLIMNEPGTLILQEPRMALVERPLFDLEPTGAFISS